MRGSFVSRLTLTSMALALSGLAGCSIEHDCYSKCYDDDCVRECDTRLSVEPPIQVTVGGGDSTPLPAAGSYDADGDGLDAVTEYKAGTDPARFDTDGDGLGDGTEMLMLTDPLSIDTDGDGADDGTEVELGLDPLSVDTDQDGFLDGAELVWGSDPFDPDTDDDGYLDGEEVSCGSSPIDSHVVCAAGTFPR